MEGTKLNFIIIDDHPISRDGLGYLVSNDPNFVIAAEAGSVEEALQILGKQEIDFALVDISLKGMNGLKLIRKIKNKYPGMHILVVSMHDENLYAERALEAGADGYIMKEEASAKVLSAIRTILSGDIYLSEAMQNRFLAGELRKMKESPKSEGIENLSDREFEIFQLIANGCGPTQIAQKLNLSVKTVETHRNNLKMKFNLNSALELREFAINWFRAHDNE